MNLVLDIGNSFVKLALFNGRELVEKSNCLIEDLNSYLIKKKFEKGIICSVNHLEYSKEIVKEHAELLILNHQLKLPILNLYKSPKTLGYDRLANAVGAFCLSPDQNNLIIDMGTCLKFDLINDRNEYLGGSISPGIKMRYQSLNTFTAKLPLLEDIKKAELIGTDTSSSISSGVINGVVSEIENMINMYRKKYAQLNIYLTGGDAQVYISIADTQKSSIFAHNYITLLGLNEILNENVA